MARQARTLSAGWNYGRKESIIILYTLELRISLPLPRVAAGRRGGQGRGWPREAAHGVVVEVHGQ